jgi:hypothetical protein
MGSDLRFDTRIHRGVDIEHNIGDSIHDTDSD